MGLCIAIDMEFDSSFCRDAMTKQGKQASSAKARET